MITKTLSQLPTAETKLSDYSRLIPVISSMLIILGVSRLIVYYGLFDVNILSFLDFGEIITSFLDIILTALVSLLFSLIPYLLFPKEETEKHESVIQSSEDQTQLQDEEAYLKRSMILQKEGRRLKWRLFFLTLLLLAIIILVVLHLHTDLKTSIGLILLLIASLILGFVIMDFQEKQDSKMIRELCLLAIVFVIGEAFVVLFTMKDHQQTINENRYLGTTIVFNDEIKLKDSSHSFVSDSLNFYIGNTNNYIFIHHKKEEITSVFPMSAVTRIDFKKTKTQTWFSK